MALVENITPDIISSVYRPICWVFISDDINTVKFDNNKPLFLSIENNRDIEINFILAPKMT